MANNTMTSKITPQNAQISAGTNRLDVLHNMDVLIELTKGRNELRETVKTMSAQMSELEKNAAVRELHKPTKDKDQSIVHSIVGKEVDRDAKDIVLIIGAFSIGFYILCKLFLLVPLNFFFVLGPIAHLIGLALGLVAYWPLWIPAKIVAILTPLTIDGFYDTLYGPVLGYVKFVLMAAVGLIAFLVIYRASGAMQKKSEYKREKKYYNKNKSNYPQQEQYRVANVKKQIDALKPQLEAAQAELKSYEETVDGLAKYMKFSLMTSVTPERLPLLRRYIENMRADTPSEAEKAYNMDQNHKLKLEQLAADFLKQQKDLERIAVLRGISVSSAEINMEHARYEAERSAKRAHNAAVLEDYKWHEMVGDIDDMENYAFMKLMDLEF